MISSRSISALHADFVDLYADRFRCNQGVLILSVVNLSVLNAYFTTLSDVPRDSFAYMANLNSDAQLQIDHNVSLVPHILQTPIYNASTLSR